MLVFNSRVPLWPETPSAVVLVFNSRVRCVSVQRPGSRFDRKPLQLMCYCSPAGSRFASSLAAGGTGSAAPAVSVSHILTYKPLIVFSGPYRTSSSRAAPARACAPTGVPTGRANSEHHPSYQGGSGREGNGPPGQPVGGSPPYTKREGTRALRSGQPSRSAMAPPAGWLSSGSPRAPATCPLAGGE